MSVSYLRLLREVQQEPGRLAVSRNFQIFEAVRSEAHLQFHGAGIFLDVVGEQVLLDGLNGLGVRVFPMQLPRSAADVADVLIRIRLA